MRSRSGLQRLTAGPLLVALAWAGLATPRAVAADRLQVAVEDEAAPWSDRDGTGFANDLVVAAFRAAGVEVDLLVVPYARCKRMVVRGDVAACFSMSWLPELEGLVTFPREPLFSCTAQVYEAVERPVGAARLEALPRGTVVGTVLGYEYPAAFHALVRSGALAMDESQSEEVALQRLAAGRLPLALVMVDGVVKRPERLLAAAGVGGKVRPAFVAGVNRSYIGFSRRHPRGGWAQGRFEAGLGAIRAAGEVARIEAVWRGRAAGALRAAGTGP
jgi:polar amino acid transport system substrate-binding protein